MNSLRHIVRQEGSHYSYWCDMATLSSPKLDEKCRYCGAPLVLLTVLDEFAQTMIDAVRAEKVNAEETREESDYAYNKAIDHVVDALLEICGGRGLTVS